MSLLKKLIFIACIACGLIGAESNPVDVKDQIDNVKEHQASVPPHNPGQYEDGSHMETSHHVEGVHLYTWRWDAVYYSPTSSFKCQVMVCAFIITALVLKILFHHATWLEKLLPESCVLIILGGLVGLFITRVDMVNPLPLFTANLFFNILLPPVILDAAISLHKHEFFANFYSIMIFAVFGTISNIFVVGLGLYGLGQAGVLGDFEIETSRSNTVELGNISSVLVDGSTHLPNEITTNNPSLGLFPALTFGSLISAVDPVAVLAIFEQIEVNAGLYFLVFGESLFNDGVCVVLYNSMNTLSSLTRPVTYQDIFMAFLSFFTVAFGGALIGFVHGIFCSLISRFTKHVRVAEPLAILTCAYSAFLWAEVFHWSGIISLIAYGVTAKHYAFQNISQKSFTTVKYAVKTIATTSDCIIFLFLGMSIFTEKHLSHPQFITASILLCIVARFASTFLFSALINLKRKEKIRIKEQIIMWWGGLRGAVGFALATVLNEDLWYREIFVTTALVKVLFTVFLQGSTIRLMVEKLKINLQAPRECAIGVEIQNKVIEDTKKGVLAICGNTTTNGAKRGYLASRWNLVDKKVKEVLLQKSSKHELERRFEAITVKEHFTNLYGPRLLIEQMQLDSAEAGREMSVEEVESEKKFNELWNLIRRELQYGRRTVSSFRQRAATINHGYFQDEEDSWSRELLEEWDEKKRNIRTMKFELMTQLSKEQSERMPADLDDAAFEVMKARYANVQAKKKDAPMGPNRAEKRFPGRERTNI